jgi:four helix bundle protein
MFHFESLQVYGKARTFNRMINEYLSYAIKSDFIVRDQLRRAALSVLLNIAEGSGRFSAPDRRHFLVMSRSSLFETIAILQLLMDLGKIPSETFQNFYKTGQKLSVALLKMIQNEKK